jgi:predicted O-methyltransferase YrrM
MPNPPEPGTGGPPRHALLTALDGVEGWLRPEQAEVLWRAASRLPDGASIVEIGSYRGRSTIVLAKSMPSSARLVAVDPHAGNGTRPVWQGPSDEGDADNERFWVNLQRKGIRDRVEHVRERSDTALIVGPSAVDLLYIDGAHEYAVALHDLVWWGARVRDGGTLLIHDAFNSVGVTLALLRWALPSRDFRYVGRVRSLGEYRREHRSRLSHLGDVGRHIASLPWFLRNVVIKVLRPLHLESVNRLLGNHGEGTY